APSFFTASMFSSRLEVTITLAPSAVASCTANTDTPASALHQHGLPRLNLTVIDQCVPGCQRCNGQGGGLFVGHVVGRAHGTVFVDDHVFGQSTWQWRAKAVIGFVRAGFPIKPPGIKVRVDAVAYRESADAFSNCHNTACNIADRDQGLGYQMRFVDAVDDRLVAEVQ